jgi:hypothetical protein
VTIITAPISVIIDNRKTLNPVALFGAVFDRQKGA